MINQKYVLLDLSICTEQIDQQLKRKMFQLPDQDLLRQTTSYTDMFMLTLLYNIGIYGIFAFALFLFFLVIKLYHLRKKKFEEFHKRQSLLTYQQSNRDSANQNRQFQSQQTNKATHIQITNSEQKDVVEDIQLPGNSKFTKITLFSVVNICTSIFFYLTLMSISSLYLVVYMFGLLGRGTSYDLVTVVIMFAIVLIPTIIWKVKTKTSQKFSQFETGLAITLLVLWIGASITSVLLLKGVCICVFNDNYGIKINKVFVFSTEFTRSQHIQQVCKPQSLCHLYATLPEQTSTSVIMNAHTGLDIKSLNISLKSGNNTFSIMENSTISLDNVQYIAQRNVYSFLFTGLTPNTLYNVTIIDPESGKILNQTSYLTLPDQQAQQIRFAVGGDVGLNEDAVKLTSYLVDYDPHVILIGGDIAYDDGMDTCFYSWDNFYNIFEDLNRNVSRIVPIVLTVGNHDVGFDALADVQKQYTNLGNTPYFFTFNPQQIKNGKIPKYNQRTSYHTHKIGPTIHVHLDSGYVNSYSSQIYLLKYVNTQYKKFYRFANYHNPLYPSCTVNETNSNDMNVISNGTENWIPYFDNGGYIAAFQHHTHHRKFTKKIKSDQPVQQTSQGVRYVGDGSWGVPEGGCGVHRQTKRPQYFEYMDHGDPNHIWLLTLKKKSLGSHELNYTAIDLNNTVVFSKTDSLILPG